MSIYLNTCRVCGEQGKGDHYSLIKYSSRHYAHADCALEKWGAAFFERLTPWQVYNQFPVSAARKAGLMKELEARIRLVKE